MELERSCARLFQQSLLAVLVVICLAFIGCGGGGSTTSAPPPPSGSGASAPSVSLAAQPTTVGKGSSTTLTWNSSDATSLSIDNGVGSVALSGTISVSPAQTTTYTATATGAGGTANAKATVTVTPPSLQNSINHIVFFVQENRSMDTYFGRLNAYRQSRGFKASDFDGIPLTLTPAPVDQAGTTVQPFHERTVCTDSLNPGWDESHRDVNSGRMDGFMVNSAFTTTNDPTGQRAMGYYDQTELPYYYELATQYATSDRFFSPLLSGTIPNRMYLYAATSFGHVGVDSPPPGGWTQPTIFGAMLDAGINFRYYYQDITQVDLRSWSDFNRVASHVFPISQYFIDLQSESTTPSVIFIERDGQDEHPGKNFQPGVVLTKSFIDALMKSPAWPSSVFILTFDEGGGLYDHVPPAIVPPPDAIKPIDPTQWAGFTQTGFRIPFLIVSPWVKPHFVSHVVRDHTSILKLIETRFGIPTLTARDAWADDMTELFDFTSPPNLTVPPLPAPATNGVCNFSLSGAP